MLDKDTFSIGKGNIITADCRVSCDVALGDFNVFNGSVIIGHDTKIGSYNSFMPAVRISGEVKMGDCNFFGVASIILQQIKVGDDVKLSAGSVLMTKPKDDVFLHWFDGKGFPASGEANPEPWTQNRLPFQSAYMDEQNDRGRSS